MHPHPLQWRVTGSLSLSLSLSLAVYVEAKATELRNALPDGTLVAAAAATGWRVALHPCVPRELLVSIVIGT
jgi:hypothetical protein